MGWRRASKLALLLIAAAGAEAARAQDRDWVDPPANLGSAPPPAPVPPSPQALAPAAPATQPRPLPAPAPPVRAAEPDRVLPLPEGRPPVRSAQPQAPDPLRRESVLPAPEPRVAARPPLEESRRPEPGRLVAREEAARDLVLDYLDVWSAPNPLTLAASSEFYAPQVIFHGRAMSARALLEEKRRFVQRWPERRYRPRPGTMGVFCGGETCTVRSVFDFLAVDSDRGRRSQGVATLELVVSFRDERPVITAENSLVHGRGRGGGSLGAGDGDDEP
jgi:hypothetical protein